VCRAAAEVLVTAGLTVVMKDLIAALFDWFTLMGRNGISVGGLGGD
jgi:hypothetical protein